MITEDYVSFEVAKLLKEKGFDEPCYQCYILIDKFVETSCYEFAVDSKLIKFERLYADEQPLINSKGFRDFTNNKDKSRVFAAPTLQMAMKWLREVHCIFISIFYGLGNTKKDKRLLKWEWEVYNMIDDSLLGHTSCNTCEEAVEAAIKYCCENLI